MKHAIELAHLRRIVDKRLTQYLPPRRGRLEGIYDAMRYSVFAGGKRLRPILAIEAAYACGGKLAQVLPVACAVELVHTYSLIHDDLPAMDDDDYRRGKPACHKVFGEANAILAGDALIPLAFGIIARSISAFRAASVIVELSEAIGAEGMVGGQSLDLAKQKKTKDRKTLEYINRLKTARLFQASTACGAISSGASQNKVEAVSEFGLYLGLSYQITDDIFDDGEYCACFGRERAVLDARRHMESAERSIKRIGVSGKRLESLARAISTRKH